MGRALILDTNVLVDCERGIVDRASLDEDEARRHSDHDRRVSDGHRAGRLASASGRSRTLAAILESGEVLDYTVGTADQHARLLAHTRRNGRRRD